MGGNLGLLYSESSRSSNSLVGSTTACPFFRSHVSFRYYLYDWWDPLSILCGSTGHDTRDPDLDRYVIRGFAFLLERIRLQPHSSLDLVRGIHYLSVDRIMVDVEGSESTREYAWCK